MIKKLSLALGFTVLFLFLSNSIFASEQGRLYNSARAEAGIGNKDFAFSLLSSLVREYPESKYLENALFAIGEYHFSHNNLPDSAAAFSRILEEFPDSKSTVFVMAYLLKIAQKRQSSDLGASLEKAIATFHKLSLVFRKSKEFVYRSALRSKYKVIYFIDKVEFYKDGEPFAQVAY